jgi:hypothetical protein
VSRGLGASDDARHWRVLPQLGRPHHVPPPVPADEVAAPRSSGSADDAGRSPLADAFPITEAVDRPVESANPRIAGTFKPSVGLEPTTPSLPWQSGASPRSRSAAKLPAQRASRRAATDGNPQRHSAASRTGRGTLTRVYAGALAAYLRPLRRGASVPRDGGFPLHSSSLRRGPLAERRRARRDRDRAAARGGAPRARGPRGAVALAALPQRVRGDLGELSHSRRFRTEHRRSGISPRRSTACSSRWAARSAYSAPIRWHRPLGRGGVLGRAERRVAATRCQQRRPRSTRPSAPAHEARMRPTANCPPRSVTDCRAPRSALPATHRAAPARLRPLPTVGPGPGGPAWRAPGGDAVGTGLRRVYAAAPAGVRISSRTRAAARQSALSFS